MDDTSHLISETLSEKGGGLKHPISLGAVLRFSPRELSPQYMISTHEVDPDACQNVEPALSDMQP